MPIVMNRYKDMLEARSLVEKTVIEVLQGVLKFELVESKFDRPFHVRIQGIDFLLPTEFENLVRTVDAFMHMNSYGSLAKDDRNSCLYFVVNGEKLFLLNEQSVYNMANWWESVRDEYTNRAFIEGLNASTIAKRGY